MKDIGIKFVKTGSGNVFTAKPHELSYSSSFDTLKIYKKGEGVASVTSGSVTTIAIDHNLGYRPAFVVFSEIPTDFGATGQYYFLPFTYPIGGDVSIVPYITKNQLKIRYGADLNAGTVSYNYRYFIFYNRAVPPWTA